MKVKLQRDGDGFTLTSEYGVTHLKNEIKLIKFQLQCSHPESIWDLDEHSNAQELTCQRCGMIIRSIPAAMEEEFNEFGGGDTHGPPPTIVG